MRPLAPGLSYSGAMPYEVHTPVFEGPFDLLLHLITKEQVDLYEVSLSKIVDAYLTELDHMAARSKGPDGEGLDLEVATEFLLIAATLVELKSRRLLPNTEDGDLDEELALWEERDLLLARLVECKTFKDAAAAIAKLMDAATLCIARQAGIEEPFIGLVPDLLEGVSPERIKKAYLKAVAVKPVVTVDLHHVAPLRQSVQDVVEELRSEIPREGRVTLRYLTRHLTERLDIIMRFLAVLEMYKQGFVEVDQTENFGDLHVSWIEEPSRSQELVDVDSYEG